RPDASPNHTCKGCESACDIAPSPAPVAERKVVPKLVHLERCCPQTNQSRAPDSTASKPAGAESDPLCFAGVQRSSQSRCRQTLHAFRPTSLLSSCKARTAQSRTSHVYPVATPKDQSNLESLCRYRAAAN